MENINTKKEKTMFPYIDARALTVMKEIHPANIKFK